MVKKENPRDIGSIQTIAAMSMPAGMPRKIFSPAEKCMTWPATMPSDVDISFPAKYGEVMKSAAMKVPTMFEPRTIAQRRRIRMSLYQTDAPRAG